LLPPDQLAKYKEAAKKKLEQVNRIKNQQKILNASERSLERTSKNVFGEVGHNVGSMAAEERRNAAGDTYKKGGKVSSASKRGDGCAIKGKTKGRLVQWKSTPFGLLDCRLLWAVFGSSFEKSLKM
jgi:hypothetical protein